MVGEKQRTSDSRRPTPELVLVLLGVASATIYAVMVLLYPLFVHGTAERPFDLEQLSRGRSWAALVYVVGLIALFAAFGMALQVARTKRVSPTTILLFGLLFAVILVGLYPVTATDLFGYVLRGRVSAVHGANPLAVPADQFPDDPLLPFVGEWSGIASPYGPAWELLAGTVVGAGFDGTVNGSLAFKVVALLAYLACTALVAWGTDGDVKSILFFAWNPLVLLEGVGNGHNDLLMLVWVVLGVLLWEKKGKWVPAVAAVALAVLIKASAALLAPILMVSVLRRQETWRKRVLVLVGAAALAAGLVALIYLPFWPIWDSLIGVLNELGNRYTYTVAALIRMILRLFLPYELSLAIPRTVGRVVMAVLYLWVLLQVWRERMSVAEAGLFSYLAYLLTSTSYRIWYPLWLVPLAALCLTPDRRLRVFTLCLTSELSILMFYLVWRWVLNGQHLPRADWLTMHLLTVPWQFGAPFLLPALARRGGRSNEPEKDQPAAT